MKKIFASALVVAAFSLVGCSGNSSNNNDTQKDALTDTAAQAEITDEPADLGDIKVSADGTIDEKEWKAGETATITLSRLPESLGEFKGLQERIGNTPEGAVVLQLAAFELYHQNKSIGEQCIRLNNTETNVPSVMRRIPEVYSKDENYARPYLVASYLEGATPQNGYNPTKPYTIKVRTSAARKYERCESLKGYLLYLEVYSSGYEASPWRGCDVIKQKGSDFYKVNNSPSMYVQCMEIPFDSDAEYKGI